MAQVDELQENGRRVKKTAERDMERKEGCF